jgi:hypothetical protein
VYALKAYEDVKVSLHSVLTFPLDGVNDQLYTLVTIPLGIEPLVSTEQDDVHRASRDAL